jgi:GT2 family glycosyltransferase
VRDGAVTVVVATRNRAAELDATLARLLALPEEVPVVVVDNASDHGAQPRARHHPRVRVLELRENLGAAARTVGTRHADSPYVAFSDDDSWWAPGSLELAAALLDSHPRLALVAARILVGPEERLDPVSAAMASSPLEATPDLPGQPVLGFLACGAVVRRAAFLQVGGFHRRFGVGGEEALLALDLAATGWGLAYVDQVVAHHHPSTNRDHRGRRRAQVRNQLWLAWLRRPLGVAAGCTVRALVEALGDRDTRAGTVQALGGLPWVVRARHPVPPLVEADLRRLAGESSLAGCWRTTRTG